MDGTIEAKPELSELLARVRAGETLTIIQDGRPVATVAPARAASAPGSEAARLAVDGLLKFRAEHRLGGLTWRDLVDEGKKGL